MNVVEILWVMLLEYEINWGIKQHSHEFYQLFFTLVGTGKEMMQVENEKIPINAGNGILVKPNESHVLLPIKNENIRIIDIKFYLKDPNLISLIDTLPRTINNKNQSFIEKLLEIRKEWKTKKPYNQELSCILMEQVIYLLARDVLSKETQKVEARFTDPNKIHMDLKNNADGITLTMIDYIDENYNKDFSLDKMANSLSYSKSYLCRKFKEDTNWTISNYLNLRKVLAAIELLQNTQKSIEEITTLTGFSSAQYFSNTFKKIVGLSPLALRESEMNEIVSDTLSYGKFQYRYQK